MASTTRRVLDYFEQTGEAVSLTHLARDLEITQGVLEGILAYWVRKGELREIVVDETVCTSCGVKNGCPFVTVLPRYYERAGHHTDDESLSCNCRGGSCGV